MLGGSPSPSGAENGPGNVIVDHDTALQTGDVISADEAPSRGFTYTNNITPHNRYGVKGSDTGTGLSALKAFFPGAVFEADVLIGAPCSLYPTGTFCPATIDEVGFVDYAEENYRLAKSSPYRELATDGTAIGADIDSIAAATD
jgi:hypothetical protein